MAFKLIKRNKIPVRIKGELPDDNGKAVPFDFTLNCIRLPQSEIDKVFVDTKGLVKDFVKRVAEGWDHMQDGEGQPLAFSEADLDDLLENPGMPAMIYHAYMKQVAAVAKN